MNVCETYGSSGPSGSSPEGHPPFDGLPLPESLICTLEPTRECVSRCKAITDGSPTLKEACTCEDGCGRAAVNTKELRPAHGHATRDHKHRQNPKEEPGRATRGGLGTRIKVDPGFTTRRRIWILANAKLESQ